MYAFATTFISYSVNVCLQFHIWCTVFLRSCFLRVFMVVIFYCIVLLKYNYWQLFDCLQYCCFPPFFSFDIIIYCNTFFMNNVKQLLKRFFSIFFRFFLCKWWLLFYKYAYFTTPLYTLYTYTVILFFHSFIYYVPLLFIQSFVVLFKTNHFLCNVNRFTVVKCE